MRAVGGLLHEESKLAEPPFTAREGRKFGFPVGLAFLVLTGLLWWRGRIPAAMATGSAATLLLLGGLLIPARLGPVHRAWMGLAHALSRVTTPVFMSVVYYVVLTPAGLLRRTVGRHPLRRDRANASHWLEREGEAASGDMTRRF